MPLKTLVKVSSLTNLSDARYCAGMGVQLMGFQTIEGHPHHITAARFQEIRGWISGPAIVAEVYGLRDREQLDRVIESFRPDYLEASVAELPLLRGTSLPLILRGSPVAPPDAGVSIAYVVAEIDDIQINGIQKIVPVSTPSETEDVLSQTNVAGIMVQGSDELSPGLKTYDTLAPILEMLDDDN